MPSHYYFVHFYPTLVSLKLSRPVGQCRPVLRFALQFPNLEGLYLEWLENTSRVCLVQSSRSSSDNLQLYVGTFYWQESMPRSGRRGNLLTSFQMASTFDLSNSETFLVRMPSIYLNACASTLKDLILVLNRTGARLVLVFIVRCGVTGEWLMTLDRTLPSASSCSNGGTHSSFYRAIFDALDPLGKDRQAR
jgi:hypothetical protein